MPQRPQQPEPYAAELTLAEIEEKHASAMHKQAHTLTAYAKRWQSRQQDVDYDDKRGVAIESI